MGRVGGKVALITGAARGQGRSHALRLAEEGADVVIIDICADIESNRYPLARPEDLAEVAQMVHELGRRAVAAQADVRDLAGLKKVVADAVDQLGPLDIVVANAGICPLGADLPPRAFLDAVDVDLSGVVNTLSAACDHLRDGASIIVTGSVAGLISGGGTEGQGPGGLGYSFAKRTITALVRDLGRVMAPQFIRVNAVHPTNCNTAMLQSQPMYDVFRPDLDSPTREDAELAFPAMNSMPVGYVEPADVTDAVVFLASDESKFITGQNLPVDAGAVLKNP